MILGNYSADTNLLGTLGQVALGFFGLDLPADIRDLLYDITHWKLTPSHALQTLFDVAALLPVVGSLKYTDEAIDALKGVAKHGDDVAEEVVKTTKHGSERLIERNFSNIDIKNISKKSVNRLTKNYNWR